MKFSSLLAAAALSLLPATPGHAQNAEVLKTAPAQLKPDRAYILLRTNGFKRGRFNVVPMLLRALRPDGTQAAPLDEGMTANLFSVRAGDFLEEMTPFRTYLIETAPGTHVIFGMSRSAKLLDTCFCLGTLGFEARAGQIVDIGTLMMGDTVEKSEIPELASESGFGQPPSGVMKTEGMGVRLPGGKESIPRSLAGFPVAPADYRAVGPFLETGSLYIARLAAVDGVLAYSRGVVIDVKSNRALEIGEIAR